MTHPVTGQTGVSPGQPTNSWTSQHTYLWNPGKNAGLVETEWTPRELRHSFVSLLSDNGMPIEQISRLMGHNGTTVTELVYRHQLRPIVEHGAEAMDRIFSRPEDDQAA